MAHTYSICKDIKRQPKKTIANIGAITSNFRVLPLYEKTVYEDTLRHHYSLVNNELLKCKWAVYVDECRTKTHVPFTFPSANDEHFHNQNLRWIPSESIRTRSSYAYNFAVGPGVNKQGYVCLLPNDMNFYRPSEKQKAKDKEKKQKQTIKQKETLKETVKQTEKQ